MAIQHQHTTLANGVRIHAEVDSDAASAAVGFFVGTGTRDEPQNIVGVSHFLEHMMFKGSAHRGAEEVNRDFDLIGANHNAFTSSEMTAYHASVLPEHIPRATELVADLFRPALRDADFDEEKGVILEEIAMYADDPSWTLYEASLCAYFGSHPLAYPVLGTPESIKAMRRDDLATYFRQHYAASNTVVSAAGRIDFDAFVQKVESETRDWPKVAPLRVHGNPPANTTRINIETAKATRGYLGMMWPGPSEQSDDRYVAGLCAYILGGSDNSRLYWALVDQGVAQEADCGNTSFDCTGAMSVSAVCDVGKLTEVESIVRAELEKFKDTVADEEIHRARVKMSTAAVLGGERPAGRMTRLGVMMLRIGKYSSLEEELAKCLAIERLDLQNFVDRWPLLPRLVVTVVPPNKE